MGTEKEVHLYSSRQCSSYCELPFTNQVCLWIARLLILTQAFTKSAACVGHGHSLAIHGHTHTHTLTHINNSQSLQPPRHLPTVNCTAHVVSYMTGSSIKTLLDFLKAMSSLQASMTGIWASYSSFYIQLVRLSFSTVGSILSHSAVLRLPLTQLQCSGTSVTAWQE